MLISDFFPSKYVAAADLRGAPVQVTIANVTIEELEGKKKLILWFTGQRKGLMLNKTNAKVIAKLYGDEVSAWFNRTITIYPSECSYKGDIVPCIRVKTDLSVQAPALNTVSLPPAQQPPAPNTVPAPNSTAETSW